MTGPTTRACGICKGDMETCTCGRPPVVWRPAAAVAGMATAIAALALALAAPAAHAPQPTQWPGPGVVAPGGAR